MTRLPLWMIEVKAEMDRARGLHPDPALLVTAFSEEAGEVVKAVLDHLAKKGPLSDVRKELIQAAAMVGRLLEEGDPAHSLPPLDPPRWESVVGATTVRVDEEPGSDHFFNAFKIPAVSEESARALREASGFPPPGRHLGDRDSST